MNSIHYKTWNPFETGITRDSESISHPLRIKPASRFLVQAVPDLFHHSIEFEVIERIFAVMSLCPSHRFHVIASNQVKKDEFFQHHMFDFAKSINESMEHFDDYIRGRNGTVRRSLKSVGWDYAFERSGDDEHDYKFFYHGPSIPAQITLQRNVEQSL
ncbi:MAG TPA: DUF5131 family protein [Pyrinomonadaceae bacterium]|nr:DUF5131 family protein [Chloracidobacterium sp.]HRK50826.1 DUF5131 family protein [Pyrinomonadaceae bacterium]